MNSGVYSLRNGITGEEYVGASGDIRSRGHQHFCKLRAGKHHSPLLQESYSLYGEIAFSIHVLELCNPSDEPEKEREWVERLRPAFNANLLPAPELPRAEPDGPVSPEELASGDWLPLSAAATATALNRNTLASWVRLGLLKSRAGTVRNLKTTLVSVKAVNALKAKGMGKPGRPRKESPQ